MIPAIGQTGTKQKVQASLTGIEKPVKSLQSTSANKDITCMDTLYYPYLKESLLPAVDTFYNLPTAQNEMEAQAYLNPGTITVSGVVFFASKATTDVTVEVSLYNVDASLMPTTLIAGTTGTVAVTLTTAAEYAVNFTTPVSVTGNYAVVLKNTTNKTLNIFANNAYSTTYGEGLGYCYWDAGTGMAWMDHENTWGQDMEILAHPIVSYPITTDYLASDYTVCPGTSVSFTMDVTPLALIQHRMYTWDAFSRFWSITVPDSTFAWDMGDGSNLLWTGNHNYTFNVSGPDTVVLYTLGGLWNSCLDYAGYIFTVYNNPTVTATANPTAICPGGTSSLTAGGASTYSWSTGSALNPLTVTPSGTTTYSVTGTDVNLCTNSATVTVTQNLAPTIGINASATTICNGGSVTLTGTGGVAYAWSTGAMTTAITVSPTATTVYTVGGQDINGCTGSTSITITVNPKPTIGATATPASVCPGVQSSLSATGGVTYAWNPGGLSGTPVNVTPTSTTIYSVTGTDANNCTNTASVTLNVFTAPTVGLVAALSPICEGTSTTLTASGAINYSWSNGLPAGVSNLVSPVSTTTYSVTGTDVNNCSAFATATVNVNPKPTVLATATPSTLCTGQSTTLSASGAATYSWDNGLGTGNNFNATPLVNTTYGVTGTDGNNCTNTASVVVNVAPCSVPTASITFSDNDICIGQSITYTDNSSGVNVDTWAWTFAGGSIAAAGTQGPHTVTYNTAGSYNVTLTVTDDNGTDDTTIAINVHSLPVVSASASINPVCSGTATSLTASGAATYSWNGGSTANPYAVSPTTMTTYSVTGTDIYGCQNSTSVTVNVNALPTITLTPSNTTICPGASSTLTAGGGVSYIWNQGLSGTVNTVSPLVNTTYAITGTDVNNCQNTASVTIVINAAPTVNATANPTTICAGQPSVLTGSGTALAYSWDGSTTTNPITVNPTTTTTYVVGGANISGCTATASVTVTVNPAPTITASATPAAVCLGGSAVLTAGGATNYEWTGSITNNPYTVTPTTTTTYNVTGTDGSGCSSTASTQVTVNSLPTVTVVFPSDVATVCQDSLVALSGGSPAGGVWSGTGVTGSNFLANTIGAFTVTYTYTDGNTCSNSATGTINVENCTSISEFSNNEMVVYPNPASDVITISFGKVDASLVEISMFDLSGRLVSNEVLNLNGSTVEVSVNQLPAGVYTLKVKAGSDVFITKITRL